MSKRYVLTMTAANRVGILAATTSAIGDLGGDIVEVRQTLLQGFFTMIIAADFPEAREVELVRNHVRSACERYGVEVTLKDPAAETVPDHADATDAYRLELVGPDQPGVLKTLSGHLSALGIDVTDLHTARAESSRTFRGVMQLAVPASIDVDSLREEIEEFGQRTSLEVVLNAEPNPGDSGVGLALPEATGKPR